MAVSYNRLDTNGFWMVGNAHIYIPSLPCKVEHSNVVGSSSGRDESGVMHIDWVRRDVRKVLLTYNVLTATELAYMMDKMQGKEFTFKFWDDGAVQTINAYVGECSYEAYRMTPSEKIYTKFSINVIEK